MDDERFYELIRRTFIEVRRLELLRHDWSYAHFALMDAVERELRYRENAAVVNRENALLAVKGP